MPNIDQDVLIKLYDEIEVLTHEKEDLRTSFIDLKIENNNFKKKYKIILFFLILISLLLFLSVFVFLDTKKNNSLLISEYKKQITKKIDSVKKENLLNKTLNLDKSSKKNLIYTIQIGAFKKLELNNFSDKVLKNFKKEINNNLYTYSIGKLITLNEAKTFLKHIKKIGIKDAFILPIKNNHRLTLEQALEEEKKPH